MLTNNTLNLQTVIQLLRKMQYFLSAERKSITKQASKQLQALFQISRSRVRIENIPFYVREQFYLESMQVFTVYLFNCWTTLK